MKRAVHIVCHCCDELERLVDDDDVAAIVDNHQQAHPAHRVSTKKVMSE